MSASTVDPRELDYYTRLADQWWDENGKFWPLHRLNRLRVAWLRDQVCRHFGRDPMAQRPLQGLDLLDIGCGGGILAESMARLGASVKGIDVVERNIEVARLHAHKAGLAIDYEQVDVETVAARAQTYDVLLNMEVVEHVANLETFMSLSTGPLDSNGILFVATINRNPLSWLFAIVGAEYILRWLPVGTHRWRKFVKPAELETLLADSGLEVTTSTGVRVNPLTRGFALSRVQSVNYMLAATRRKG